MKSLLLIRSVSFQQLDNNLAHIRAAFPDHSIHLLTHEHGRRLAEKYTAIANIVIYPHCGAFTAGIEIPDLGPYDAVLVPVTNLSGAGFINVFQFAASLPAERLYCCNLVGKIAAHSRAEIAGWVRRDRFVRWAGKLIGVPLGALAVIWFSGAIMLLRYCSRNTH